MSKLEIVRAALQSRADIKIVDIDERDYLPGRVYCSWSQEVTFVIAPIEVIPEAGRLQELLDGLIPDAEKTAGARFKVEDIYLSMGSLVFDEIIGSETVQRVIKATDEQLARDPRFDNGSWVITRETELHRQTMVRLFPGIDFAEAFVRHEAYRFKIPVGLVEARATAKLGH